MIGINSDFASHGTAKGDGGRLRPGRLGPSRRLVLMLATGFGLLALLGSSPAPAHADAADDLAWVEDIVLRPTFVDMGTETGTFRWAVAPKVTVVGGTRDQQKAVADVIQHLNEPLKKTSLKKIELLKPSDPAATFRVCFVRRSEIPAKAAELGEPRNVVDAMAKEKWVRFTFLVWGQQKREARAAVMLMASDMEFAKKLNRNLLIALCGSLGLQGQSKRDRQSFFYRDGDNVSDAEKLTAKDQQLINWFYNHVPANSSSVKELYEKHWPKAVP